MRFVTLLVFQVFFCQTCGEQYKDLDAVEAHRVCKHAGGILINELNSLLIIMCTCSLCLLFSLSLSHLLLVFY